MSDTPKAPEHAQSVEGLAGKVQPDPEIQYLRAEIARREKTIHAQRTQIGELNNVAAHFGEAIRTLPPPKTIDIPKYKTIHAPSEAQFWCTDVHYGERVDPEEMEYFGEYNAGIARARLWAATQKVIELVDMTRKSAPVDEITIGFLGDMVTGDIHAELERTADIQLPMAIVELGDLLAQMATILSGHFTRVKIVGVCGNHGRKDQKPVAKQRADRNWDTSVYHIAKAITRTNERIEWKIPRSQGVIAGLPGCDVLIKHGDGIKAAGTTPYYGLVRDTSREYQKRRKTSDFDYVFQGHLHHWGMTEGNRILCPSLIGPNEYSCNQLHSVFPPAQLLTFMTAKNDLGLIDMRPIWLENAKGHGFLQDVTTQEEDATTEAPELA